MVSTDTQWTDLSLLPQHVEVLRSRGISPATAQLHGYRSSEGEEDLRSLGYEGAAAKVSSALVIPLHDADGEVVGHQIRPDVELLNSRGRVLKYASPRGQRNVVDVPVSLGARGINVVSDPNVPLVVTEGPLKAAAAATRGIPCISIQGVSSYVGTSSTGGKGVLLPDWRMFARNRHWIVGYDSDAMTKNEVLREARRLGRLLGDKPGASVSYLMLPATGDEKIGLDDWLVAHPGAGLTDLLDLTRDELPTGLGEEVAGDRKPVPARDLDVADLWVDQYAKTCRFNTTTARWMHYERGVWKSLKGDSLPAANAQDLIRTLWAFDMVNDGAGGTRKADATDWLHSANRVTAVLRQASSNRRAQVSDERFDQHPHLLNLSNGTLNLLTSTLLPHDPGHLLTGGTRVNFDAAATAPQFQKFIREVLPDDDTRGFVQRLFGMALLGEVRQHVLTVFVGTGRNGKGALLEIMQALFGDYATGIHKDLLVETKFEGHPTHMMTLKGARLAVAQELNKSAKWDVAMVKSLTGGDRITGRYTGADEVTFTPSHTLVMATNHRPAVGEGEKAFWARYREVPFDQDFTGREDDTLVSRIIRAELPGVLQWVLAGLREFLATGLGEPDSVKRASAGAREESDPMFRFADDMLTRSGHKDEWIPNAEMFGAWQQWCNSQDPRETAGVIRMFPKNFAASTGLVAEKKEIGKVWVGVKWRSQGEPDTALRQDEPEFASDDDEICVSEVTPVTDTGNPNEVTLTSPLTQTDPPLTQTKIHSDANEHTLTSTNATTDATDTNTRLALYSQSSSNHDVMMHSDIAVDESPPTFASFASLRQRVAHEPLTVDEFTSWWSDPVRLTEGWETW